jgi:hypothetical protein
VAARLSDAEEFPDELGRMNKSHSILPLSSFILFLTTTYIAALDEASRPKISIATVFRRGVSRIGFVPFSPAQCGNAGKFLSLSVRAQSAS